MNGEIVAGMTDWQAVAVIAVVFVLDVLWRWLRWPRHG